MNKVAEVRKVPFHGPALKHKTSDLIIEAMWPRLLTACNDSKCSDLATLYCELEGFGIIETSNTGGLNFRNAGRIWNSEGDTYKRG
jgi:hypothetical protein